MTTIPVTDVPDRLTRDDILMLELFTKPYAATLWWDAHREEYIAVNRFRTGHHGYFRFAAPDVIECLHALCDQNGDAFLITEGGDPIPVRMPVLGGHSNG